MFSWNDPNAPITDHERAFDITDMLFSGVDVKKVERELLKQYRQMRCESIDFCIDECYDKIKEIKLDNEGHQAAAKLRMLIARLEHYKEEVKTGYIPNAIVPIHHDNYDAWIAPLICGIVMIWVFTWILL